MPSTVAMVLPAAAFAGVRQLSDRLAVDQHRAGAADPGAADELGSRQAERAAQPVDEQRIVVVGEVDACVR